LYVLGGTLDVAGTLDTERRESGESLTCRDHRRVQKVRQCECGVFVSSFSPHKAEMSGDDKGARRTEILTWAVLP